MAGLVGSGLSSIPTDDADPKDDDMRSGLSRFWDSLTALAGAAAVTGVLLLIAGCESQAIVQRLPIVPPPSFLRWQEPLLDVVDLFRIWTIVSGVIGAWQMIAFGPDQPSVRDLLKRSAIGFGSGVIFPYLAVLALGLLIAVPLVLVDLVFPSDGYVATYPFACFCAACAVFFAMTRHIFRFLRFMVEQGSLIIKALGVLLLLSMLLETLMVLMKILRVLVENSFWRVDVGAAILTYAGPLVAALVLLVIRLRVTKRVPSLVTLSVVYVACVVTGNLSNTVFRWGEWPSAIVAGILAPVVYGAILYRVWRLLPGPGWQLGNFPGLASEGPAGVSRGGGDG